MRAWKLFSLKKDGSVGPLFINRTLRLEPGVWFEAEAHRTKGYSFRPYWHATSEPYAPHLSEKGRVWREVEIEDVQEMHRPESQGGTWYLAGRLKLIPLGSE